MVLCGCFSFTQKPTLNTLYNDWFDREVFFPNVINFTQYGRDTVVLNTNTPLKIICYIDSTGCTKCKMQLYMWVTFITDLHKLSAYSVPIVYNICSTNLTKITNLLIDEGFNYPVCIDISDSLNKLNHFPSDPRFHCFLLDENNRVILIGNPVQNPKIKELYLRTICERLGIEYNQNSDAKMDSKNEINLGSFPKSESKSVQFFIPNNTESEMQIDTVFTSCECTTAKIDKMSISPHQNASLSVTYTPDGVGEFFREVYVKVRGDDKPKTFVIRGNVE